MEMSAILHLEVGLILRLHGFIIAFHKRNLVGFGGGLGTPWETPDAISLQALNSSDSQNGDGWSLTASESAAARERWLIRTGDA